MEALVCNSTTRRINCMSRTAELCGIRVNVQNSSLVQLACCEEAGANRVHAAIQGCSGAGTRWNAVQANIWSRNGSPANIVGHR